MLLLPAGIVGPTSQGFSLGSLVDVILQVDPSILVTALLATTTVFVCFAGAALFAKRRSYLYLGGMLSSATTGVSSARVWVHKLRTTRLRPPVHALDPTPASAGVDAAPRLHESGKISPRSRLCYHGTISCQRQPNDCASQKVIRYPHQQWLHTARCHVSICQHNRSTSLWPRTVSSSFILIQQRRRHASVPPFATREVLTSNCVPLAGYSGVDWCGSNAYYTKLCARPVSFPFLDSSGSDAVLKTAICPCRVIAAAAVCALLLSSASHNVPSIGLLLPNSFRACPSSWAFASLPLPSREVLVLASLLNTFVRSSMLFGAELYAGLFIFCG